MEVEGPRRARSDALAKFNELFSCMPGSPSVYKATGQKTTQHETSRLRPRSTPRFLQHLLHFQELYYAFFCSSEATETLRPQLRQSTRHGIMDSPHK